MSDLVKPFGAEHEDYLRDESRRVGSADSISFPTSESDVVALLKDSRSAITTQGARTGITAGAVPNGGHVLNLSRMKEIGDVVERDGKHYLAVQPGALLDEIREHVAAQNLFFPPDPTETSASIGGMVACNASGAMSLFYGPTRNWIESLRIVLADGNILDLRRSDHKSNGRSFSVTTLGGRTISGDFPDYTWPSVKSAAGYYASDDMDLIDMFIGSEGTLGIITQIELRLIPRPVSINGLMLFFPNEDAALEFVQIACCAETAPVAIEFFNSNALNLLRKMKSTNPAFEKIPTLKDSYDTAIYIEFHGEDDDSLEDAVMSVMEPAMELGASDEDSWFATSPREMEPLKAFRHAIPEAVNLLIDERRKTNPDLTKLGTDMSVPDSHLIDMMATYNADLAESGLDSVIFGHIGNNHVHVNILPNSSDDYAKGKELYLAWAEKVSSMDGSVSAEHGIGKLKTAMLEVMYGPQNIEKMRALKKIFDPNGILNPGNLFEP